MSFIIVLITASNEQSKSRYVPVGLPRVQLESPIY